MPKGTMPKEAGEDRERKALLLAAQKAAEKKDKFNMAHPTAAAKQQQSEKKAKK